jgi:hypothetical protein
VLGGNRVLVVRFEGGAVFAAEAAPTVGDLGVTTFKIGAELPDADFALLDESACRRRRIPRTGGPHVRRC